jgi:hypothetical protein
VPRLGVIALMLMATTMKTAASQLLDIRELQGRSAKGEKDDYKDYWVEMKPLMMRTYLPQSSEM